MPAVHRSRVARTVDGPRRTAAASLALLLGVAGCAAEPDPGADPEDAPPTAVGDEAEADAAFPVTVEHAAGETTLDAPAQAVFSLSPSSTELLFAIGAGDQVTATDRFSDFPDGVPATDMSGFDPNVEAIAASGADLVVASGDRNEIVAGLAALDIPVVVHPAATSLDDVTDQIATLGQLTGRTEEAEAVADSLLADLDALADRVGDAAQGLTYYHELSPDNHTATSDTFAGALYGLLGLENIADAAPEAAEAGGFPQLSPEYVVDADPDLVFLAHAVADDEEPVTGRPGWDQLTGDVVQLDPDVASRWGPRIVDQLEQVVLAVEERLERADAA